jgi:hypothetical protein
MGIGKSLHSCFEMGSIRIAPNGLAHLPPGLAGRRNRQSVKTGKLPPRTSAEGGQVEPVLGGLLTG